MPPAVVSRGECGTEETFPFGFADIVDNRQGEYLDTADRLLRVLYLADLGGRPAHPLRRLGAGDRLLVDDLDTNQLAAVGAATVLEEALSRILDCRDGVERASKALADAVSRSARAAESHGRLAAALSALEDVVAEVADARDALEFDWPTRTR